MAATRRLEDFECAARINGPRPLLLQERIGLESVSMPTMGNTEQAMSDRYVIEVGSQQAGIVVRDPGGYRFFAASQRFQSLEGRLFRTAREAERAAARLVDAA
jgi:hypothetical protein